VLTLIEYLSPTNKKKKKFLAGLEKRVNKDPTPSIDRIVSTHFEKETQNAVPFRLPAIDNLTKQHTDLCKEIIQSVVEELKKEKIVLTEEIQHQKITAAIEKYKPSLNLLIARMCMHACNEILDEKGNLHPNLESALQPVLEHVKMYRKNRALEELNNDRIRNQLVRGMAQLILMHTLPTKKMRDKSPQVALIMSMNIGFFDEEIKKTLEGRIQKYTKLNTILKKENPFFLAAINDNTFYQSKSVSDYFVEKMIFPIGEEILKLQKLNSTQNNTAQAKLTLSKLHDTLGGLAAECKKLGTPQFDCNQIYDDLDAMEHQINTLLLKKNEKSPAFFKETASEKHYAEIIKAIAKMRQFTSEILLPDKPAIQLHR